MRSWWWSRPGRAGLLSVIVAALGGLLSAGGAALAGPATASAHGPLNPAASSFEATIAHVPPGVRARVIDGDQRLWLAVPAGMKLVVLDYRGAPYLRFDHAGVQVNQNSEMFYLNQIPVQVAPPGVTPRTPPDWHAVSSGHAYQWHDGRLSDLSTTALAPGQTHVGRWQISVRVDGAPALIAGGLDYAPSPSIVWFWPIIVVLACVLAVRRVRRRELDEAAARGLALTALGAFVVAELCHQLHGRPDVSVGQAITLAVALVFAGWAAQWVVRGRAGWFALFAIAAVAIWEGTTLGSVLVDGYVLQSGPPFLVRAAVVISLSCGIGLLPIVFSMAEPAVRARAARAPVLDDADDERRSERMPAGQPDAS